MGNSLFVNIYRGLDRIRKVPLAATPVKFPDRSRSGDGIFREQTG